MRGAATRRMRQLGRGSWRVSAEGDARFTRRTLLDDIRRRVFSTCSRLCFKRRKTLANFSLANPNLSAILSHSVRLRMYS